MGIIVILSKLVPEEWKKPAKERFDTIDEHIRTQTEHIQSSVHQKIESLGPKYQLTDYPAPEGRTAYKISQESKDKNTPSKNYYICIEDNCRTAIFEEIKDTTSKYGSVSRIITVISEQERDLILTDIKNDLNAAYKTVEAIWKSYSKSAVPMKEGIGDTYHSAEYVNVEDEFENYCINGVI